jgi:hypothetical protein
MNRRCSIRLSCRHPCPLSELLREHAQSIGRSRFCSFSKRYLHDCEYAGIEDIRSGIKQSMKRRQNMRKHVILKKEEHVNAVPLFKSDDNRRKGK